jgi:hypothetical protein
MMIHDVHGADRMGVDFGNVMLAWRCINSQIYEAKRLDSVTRGNQVPETGLLVSKAVN